MRRIVLRHLVIVNHLIRILRTPYTTAYFARHWHVLDWVGLAPVHCVPVDVRARASVVVPLVVVLALVLGNFHPGHFGPRGGGGFVPRGGGGGRGGMGFAPGGPFGRGGFNPAMAGARGGLGTTRKHL